MVTVGVPGIEQQIELRTRPEASLKWFIHNGYYDNEARYLDRDGVWHNRMQINQISGGTYFNTEEEAQEIFIKYTPQSLPPTLKPVG